ncbi:hypothetical protein C0Q70_21178 [Pomacea canaliculata]|uniref:Major facilitator superfamily (MFS) profile domain-containing protein n=1 Tax=Pomacea canaliculata TaxID=400727 RepID=A0A2T7NBS7_POMCA|nr:hypothetical protein C0Q70_21178 [Pomacea canaliculata]
MDQPQVTGRNGFYLGVTSRIREGRARAHVIVSHLGHHGNRKPRHCQRTPSGPAASDTVDVKTEKSTKKHKVQSRDQSLHDGVPYDVGWAWMIVLAVSSHVADCVTASVVTWLTCVTAGFVNFVIASGYNKATFIFFVRFLREFRDSGVRNRPLLWGQSRGQQHRLFIMNAVVGRLGTRRTVLVGGFCLSISAILGSFATNITYLICTQAIFHGLGMAMLNMPTTVLIGFYFRNRRSLANSIAKCGVGVGSVVFPPLITYLLGEYGLRGSMLLSGGICLHAIACATLLRPTSFYTRRHRRQKPRNEANDDTTITDTADDALMSKDQNSGEQSKGEPLESIPEEREVRQKAPEPDDSLLLNTPDQDGVTALLVNDLAQYTRPSPQPVTSFTRSMPELVLQSDRSVPRRRTFSENDSKVGDHKIVAKKSVLDALSHSNLNKYMSMPAIEDLEPLIGHRTLSDPEIHIKKRTWLSRTVRALRSMGSVLDFSLFRSPMFRVLSIFYLLCPLEAAVTTYMPAMAQEQGLTENQAAILLSNSRADVISCFPAPGTVFVIPFQHHRRPGLLLPPWLWVLGRPEDFAGVHHHLHRLQRAGCRLPVHPLPQHLPAPRGAGRGPGVARGVAACLLPILIMEDIGVQHTAKALGFHKLFSGAVMAAFHPLLGYIRDSTGSFNAMYHVIGVFTLLAAGVVFCIRFFSHDLPEAKDSKGEHQESIPLSKEKV